MSTRQADENEHRPSPGRGASALAWRAYDTPWGEGMVGADEDGLRCVELPRVPAGPVTSCDQNFAEEGGSGLSPKRCAALERWVEALEEYFRGERLAWTVEDIPWDDLGVRPFEREVYQSLLTVPPGETVSYGRLAEMAGHPRAGRAVGSAMAANPIPVVIPCHRVIRSDGTLGNYGNDPDWKPRLLEHERSSLKARTSR